MSRVDIENSNLKLIEALKAGWLPAKGYGYSEPTQVVYLYGGINKWFMKNKFGTLKLDERDLKSAIKYLEEQDNE